MLGGQVLDEPDRDALAKVEAPRTAVQLGDAKGDVLERAALASQPLRRRASA